MQSYTEGYVTEFPYTYGYYGELNPLRAKLPLLQRGVAFPQIKRACELGFGQGLSVNINAAAGDVEWWGTDFNPSQVNFARFLARESGAAAHLYNEAFAKFCRREDLPFFDFIGIHGIWSWINDENKAAIVDLIKNRLNVGGVLYISYNCYPGWAPMVPVRELLATYDHDYAASLKKGIDEALDFADRLVALDALYMRTQPAIKARLEAIRKQDHTYLAHEYFNQSWDVMSFARMSEWLKTAMLDYVCQAGYLENVDVLNFSNEQAAFLGSIENVALRETARDFILNTQFRKDYWIRGRRQLPALEAQEAILALKFALVVPAENVDLKVKGPRGEGNLNELVYRPILAAFADNRPHAVSEVLRNLQSAEFGLPQLLEAIDILCGKNVLAAAVNPDSAAVERCKKLNGALESRAQSNADISFLASPVTTGGIVADRFRQLFLLARRAGLRQPDDLARFVWSKLSAVNQKLIKDGKVLEHDEENIAELQIRAEVFCNTVLPVLKKLAIV